METTFSESMESPQPLCTPQLHQNIFGFTKGDLYLHPIQKAELIGTRSMAGIFVRLGVGQKREAMMSTSLKGRGLLGQ